MWFTERKCSRIWVSSEGKNKRKNFAWWSELKVLVIKKHSLTHFAFYDDVAKLKIGSVDTLRSTTFYFDQIFFRKASVPIP